MSGRDSNFFTVLNSLDIESRESVHISQKYTTDQSQSTETFPQKLSPQRPPGLVLLEPSYVRHQFDSAFPEFQTRLSSSTAGSRAGPTGAGACAGAGGGPLTCDETRAPRTSSMVRAQTKRKRLAITGGVLKKQGT